MVDHTLNKLKKIKDAKLRQVVLIDNFIHYCEGHIDFLKSKEGKEQLKELIETLESKNG